MKQIHILDFYNIVDYQWYNFSISFFLIINNNNNNKRQNKQKNMNCLSIFFFCLFSFVIVLILLGWKKREVKFSLVRNNLKHIKFVVLRSEAISSFDTGIWRPKEKKKKKKVPELSHA